MFAPSRGKQQGLLNEQAFSVCSLSLWERVGVRASGRITSHLSPHPSPLPKGAREPYGAGFDFLPVGEGIRPHQSNPLPGGTALARPTNAFPLLRILFRPPGRCGVRRIIRPDMFRIAPFHLFLHFSIGSGPKRAQVTRDLQWALCRRK